MEYTSSWKWNKKKKKGVARVQAPERRDQDLDLKTSSDFLTHLGLKFAGMKIGDHEVMSHKCVREGQLSQEEVGRCVHHNRARKMSEDVFGGGDWETGFAEDDDVKRKPLRHRFIKLLIPPRNFPDCLRTRAHNLCAELVDRGIYEVPSAPWPRAS